MSLAERERQKYLGELKNKSKEELIENLKRQEKLLNNKKFIQSLPDKGKRCLECIEKLKNAIAWHEELERRTELLSAVRLEFQAKQKDINGADGFAKQKNNIVFADRLAEKKTGSDRKGSGLQSPKCGDDKSTDNIPEKLDHLSFDSESYAMKNVSQKTENIVLGLTNDPSKCSATAEKKINDTSDNQSEKTAAANSIYDEDELLIKSFGSITIKHLDADPNLQKKNVVNKNAPTDNVFLSLHKREPKQYHCISVLENRAKNPVKKKPPFKTNQLPSESQSSSYGSSGSQSPGRPECQLSKAERRLRDKQHLDDITAARLPVLHHMPTQLLSLEESAVLQIEQKQKYEEMQAKLAAEKLAEKLNIKMTPYNPEGETMKKYREIRDEADYRSSDED